MFRLRHRQISDTEEVLVGLTNNSVHFAGNVAWDPHTYHVPVRIRTSCVSE